MGTTKLRSSATAKKGVNYVRDIIESSNSIFHEIHQENDYGNDAFVELVEGTNVRGITVAVQIKSGTSYCSTETCKIPASKQHFEYWKSHTLPVIGVVYDPEEHKGYWVDIKRYITDRTSLPEEGPYTISFKKTEFSSFTAENFELIVKPIYLKAQVKLPLTTSMRFCSSDDYTEHSLGLAVLMNHYAASIEAWELMFSTLRSRTISTLDPSILYYLAHIPGHPDIHWSPNKLIPLDLKEYLKNIVADWSIEDVAKILCLLSEDESFERGSLGQNADAVISLIKDKNDKLISVIEDHRLPTFARDSAALLYAYYTQLEGIQKLRELAVEYPDLTWPSELVRQLETEGYIYLY
jgi:hypothetical protein